MTSLTAQLQTLISEIDAVLTKANPRLPWVGSSEAAQQRQVLEQTRSALASLQQQLANPPASGQPSGTVSPSAPLGQYAQAQLPPAESAQQVLQAMLQEMNYLRANMVQPLRTDLEMLRQQRDALQQEIRQLEMQRQQYAMPTAAANQQMLNDFMQALMMRLREDLSGQLAQIAAREGQMLPPDPLLTSAGAPQPLLDPAQRLEQLQALQAQSDQVLLKLDSTLRVVFESLQSNVQSYQDSLQTGLEKMHSLGQQGEAMFAALINRFAQQLGREASSYLQSSREDWQAPRSFAGTDAAPLPAQSSGKEITDAQIDLFLNELGAMAPTPSALETPPIPIAPPPPGSDFLSLELDQLPPDSTTDLSLSPDLEEDFTLFQVDALLPSDEDDEDRTVIQTGAAFGYEPTPSQQALDQGLEQLSREAAAQAQPLAGLPVAAADPAPIAPPEEATGSYAELDEFYESLFGETVTPADAADPPIEAIAAPSQPLEPVVAPPETPIDLENLLFEGLNDLADTAPVAPAEPAAAPATVEDLLFSVEPEPAALPSEDVEAIADLSELAPEAALPEETLPTLPGLGEESYVPAAPDEDLLALEDPDDRPDLDLQLNPDTLQQLSEDLSSLEERPQSDRAPAPELLEASDLPLFDDSDRTLTLEPDSPYQHPGTPVTSAIEPEAQISSLEDLFDEETGPLESPPALAEPDVLPELEPQANLAADEPTAELTLEDFGFVPATSEALAAPPEVDPLLADLEELFPPAPEPEVEPVDTVNVSVEADQMAAFPEEFDPMAVGAEAAVVPDELAAAEDEAAVWSDEMLFPAAEIAPDEAAVLDELFAEVSPPAEQFEAADLTPESNMTLADLFESDSVEPELPPEPIAAATPEEPIAASSALDELFRSDQPPAAESDPLWAALMEPMPAPPTEAAADLAIDDFQLNTAPEPFEATEEALTLADFAQDDLDAGRAEPAADDRFGDAELADLLTPEAEQPTPESSIDPDAFSDLLFFEEANSPLPEALAPEEAGLTFHDPVDAAAAPAEPDLPELEEDLLGEDRLDLLLDPSEAAFEAALNELTLDDFPDPQAESDFDLEGIDGVDESLLLDLEFGADGEAEAVPLVEIPQETQLSETAAIDELTLAAFAEDLAFPDEEPLGLPIQTESIEDNTFTLEGLDSLFEELTLPPIEAEVEAPETNLTLADDFAPAELTTEEAEDQKKKIVELEEPAEPFPAAFLPEDAEPEDLLPLMEPQAEPEAIAPAPTEAPPPVSAFDAEAEDDLFDEPDSSFTVASTANLTPVPPDDSEANAGIWCLGIDIGTTGISAVLLNRLTCELYPIYWSESSTQRQALEKSFRLPTTVYLSGSGIGDGIGSLLIDFPHSPPAADADAVLLHDFKPYLKVGVPHYSPQAAYWEPILQWSDTQPLALTALHQALRTLLATLSAQRFLPGSLNEPSAASDARLICGAVGLDARRFQVALQQLVQVMVGYPANWSDTYTLNIREAVLGARLVAHPEQICFVEEAIAAILSSLRSGDGRAVVLPNGLSQKSQLHNVDWRGGTLAISAGASVTELAIVNLPDSLSSLTYGDFTVRSLAYAGNAIDQDIICQLLYPPRFRQRREGQRPSLPPALGAGQAADLQTDSWNWQATDPDVEQSTWDSLGLADLTLPLPGEPDLENRQRLQQRLESSPLGQSLLEAAKHLKLIFQHQDRFVLELGDQQWQLSRQELGSRVILPYIQRLNRELNTLLSQTGVPMQAINQVVCTGGTGSLRAIARWLRQKLPNATIIQDTYASSRGLSPQDSRPLTCSRIAYGLATLPLHFQVLDVPRQQYSDYFLLLELLRSFPDQPLTSGGVMQLLERRGINTQACHLHVLALLEGHLPPGFVPTERDAHLLTPASQQNAEYAALLEAPLFYKRDNQTYEPNYVQWNRFQQYLSSLLASTHQTLTEPLAVNFV